MRRAAGFLLLALVISPGAAAQTTNLALYQELALDCLGELPAGVERLVVAAPDRMPYLRSALVSHWQNEGVSVFLADTSAASARLTYDVEEANVSYARTQGGLDRMVHLALRFTLTDAGGRILVDNRCVDSRSDVLPVAAVEAVQNEVYQETVGELPRAGWLRRYLEPVVLTAATAVTVFLFFSLRTRDAADS